MNPNFLFLAIFLGILIPYGHVFSFAIKYIVMGMLFFAFLDIEFKIKSSFYLSALAILATMFGMAIVLFFAIKPFNTELALISFMLTISPTAAASPVVLKLLQKNIEYATYAVLVSNTIAALAIPLLIPVLIQQDLQITGQELLASIAIVVYLPLGLSQGIKKFFPTPIISFLFSLKSISFYLWMLLLYLVTSKSAHYILHESNFSPIYLVKIAIVSLLVCILNFSIGRILGGSTFMREASQCLGQKNTAFTIWICLDTFKPTVALGPMFYIIFQNIYNSYLISKLKK